MFAGSGRRCSVLQARHICSRLNSYHHISCWQSIGAGYDDLPLHTTVEGQEVVQLEVCGSLEVEGGRAAAALKLLVALQVLVDGEDVTTY